MNKRKDKDLFIKNLKEGINKKIASLDYKNYDGIKNGFKEDNESLKGDWGRVGNELKKATEKFEKDELTEEEREALREEGEER